MQRERSLISGTVKMDVSSNTDSMSELRAAFSEIRIESQPTMEVVISGIFSLFLSLKIVFLLRLPPTCPTQNTCSKDPARSIIETQSSCLPCPVTLYTFSFLLHSIDLVKNLILMKIYSIKYHSRISDIISIINMSTWVCICTFGEGPRSCQICN